MPSSCIPHASLGSSLVSSCTAHSSSTPQHDVSLGSSSSASTASVRCSRSLGVTDAPRHPRITHHGLLIESVRSEPAGGRRASDAPGADGAPLASPRPVRHIRA
ncbi:hypothetical protein PYCCODRAFT_1430074 [Trametes coccinea BRFM310]|uniref:Uncharacterized protein n=1 Tax=Trametes coccinea (strain BRFM310) TaxID=1353009 RepID=A0A1Y2J605_TRAC3|nr:hypothetical protein PYCCODRAFT_1430074 [Trametes coccinea BRFM310]